jgi:hypothetical protein
VGTYVRTSRGKSEGCAVYCCAVWCSAELCGAGLCSIPAHVRIFSLCSVGSCVVRARAVRSQWGGRGTLCF